MSSGIINAVGAKLTTAQRMHWPSSIPASASIEDSSSRNQLPRRQRRRIYDPEPVHQADRRGPRPQPGLHRPRHHRGDSRYRSLGGSALGPGFQPTATHPGQLRRQERSGSLKPRLAIATGTAPTSPASSPTASPTAPVTSTASPPTSTWSSSGPSTAPAKAPTPMSSAVSTGLSATARHTESESSISRSVRPTLRLLG